MYIAAWPSLSPGTFLEPCLADPLPFPLESPHRTFFCVARSGIYHLVRSLHLAAGQSILAPDYHHGNEIHAMKAAGAHLQYYPVKKNLDVDLDVIRTLCNQDPRPRALYVTHFIGWPQPLREIEALCSENNLTLIEDCALSFMSTVGGRPLGTFGAYSVFCLYKSLPVPNGGVVAGSSNKSLPLSRCSAVTTAGRSAELMLQWVRSRSETAGRALFPLKRMAGRILSAGNIQRVAIGNTGFDVSSANVGMSSVCHSLLPRFRYARIKEARRRNFAVLQDRLRGVVRPIEKELVEGVCPLFFPLLVKDKRAAAKALRQSGIETVEFWNEGAPESVREGSDAAFLRRHVLEVPIHQDVTEEAAEYTAAEILRLGVGLAVGE